MEKIIEQNRSQIAELFKLYGATNAYVFGSAAKGNMRKDSDIDFLFNFAEGLHYEKYADNYFNLLYALEDLLKYNVELVAEKTLKNPYLIESINESKIQLL